MLEEPQSPTTSTTSSKIRRDTGFPEPFCGLRNTTLPHPEADLSPNASITAEDVDPSLTTKRSLRARKGRYRHTLSHGKISSSESLHATTTAGSGDDELLAEVHVVMTPDGRISKDLSVEDARASFAAEHGQYVEKKKSLLKTFLRQ